MVVGLSMLLGIVKIAIILFFYKKTSINRNVTLIADKKLKNIRMLQLIWDYLINKI